MAWHRSDDVEQFLAAAGALLLPEPGMHTLTLTSCENARVRPDGTRFGWWQEAQGEVTGAVSQTPGRALALAAVPDHAIAPLADAWHIDKVIGPTALAVQVACVAARERTVRVRHAERLFRLAELVTPEAPGAARVAGAADYDTVLIAFRAFIAEAGVDVPDPEDGLRDRLSHQGWLLWEDEGRVVAMAGHSRVAFRHARVGPVWTPPDSRGRGYGGAVTAAATQHALDAGASEVVLFTDLANPTSNALYPRLGYQPVSDRVVVELYEQ